MPIYFRPYSVFSPHTPQSFAILVPGSEPSAIFSLCFLRNFAWLSTPKNQGGIQGVEYPLVADLKRTIAQDYDVLSADGVAYRGLFLIDRDGVVRHQVVNDLPLGRSVEEAIRMVDALQHFEKHGEVCPANWTKGKEAMAATQEGVSGYLSKN